MIDYKKLRLAHELAEKCDMVIWFTASSAKDHGATAIMDIDDLIQKLQELTQPKAKYEIDDEIWFIDCENKIRSLIINEIDKTNTKTIYFNDKNGNCVPQKDEIYPTKSALIEAQLEYWVNQLKGILEFSKLTGEYRLIAEPEDEIYPPTGIKYQFDPSFEGEVDGFGQQGYKIHLPTEEYCQEWAPKPDQCQHEPEMDIGKDDRPRYIKSKNPKCMHCGEFYKVGCEHESDGYCYDKNKEHVLWYQLNKYYQQKCLKCGEFYI